MALALFDFDGTITFKDSFAGFIKYAVGQTQFYLGVACLTPVFFGFLLGLIRPWRAKELMSIFFFGGQDVRQFEEAGIEILPGGVTEDREGNCY